MKILSFDVGIKNMALCCLEVNNENKRIDILHWDVLNLLHDDSQTQCICNQYNKAKSKKLPPTVCQKKAKFKKVFFYFYGLFLIFSGVVNCIEKSEIDFWFLINIALGVTILIATYLGKME